MTKERVHGRGLSLPRKMDLYRALCEPGKTVTKVADEFGVNRTTARKANSELKLAGLKALTERPDFMQESAPVPKEEPSFEEHVTIANLRRDLRDMKSHADRLSLELGDARDLREGVLGLASEPLEPRPVPVTTARRSAITWEINLSDNHLGKRILPEEVAGLQSYDVEIACNRIRRTFAKAIELIRMNGCPVDRIIVNAMGDNVNGALRKDDDRSNEIAPIQQARVFAEAVCSGIETLKSEFSDAEIDYNQLPGNHGRTTINPPTVEIFENYDCIAGLLVEWHFRGDDRVHVSNTGQADVLLDIYGRGYFRSHGDRIGAGGGDGQIGALGPTKRGSLRISAQQHEIARYIEGWPDQVHSLFGHFHYQWMDMDTATSGAACGPDPYSFRSNRMRAKPQPPTQWLFGIEPNKGLIEAKWLFVGHPDEGPICSFGRGHEPR